MKEALIIRYCEIHLKGKNRGYFERLLEKNVERALGGISHAFVKARGRYLVQDYAPEDFSGIADKLKKVFGIHTMSRALVVSSDMEEIRAAALAVCPEEGEFKVDTKRANKKFPLNSMEISRELGGYLLSQRPGLKVNVTDPAFTVHVDVREDGQAFVFSEFIKGAGGMPSGSAGRGLLLLSGGIDSPVAGYMMARRGMSIDALHFHSFPYTGQAAKEKVEELARQLSEYACGVKLHVVSFTHIQEAIHEHCPEEFMITLMRRFMMRIAERLARREGDQCLITGESLGQVASQTVESMTSSNSVVELLPVLRPLVGFDKLDIIEIAQKIGTYDTSILPYEDCCTVFLPKYPAIRPNLEKVIAAESRLDVEGLISRAMENIEEYCY